MSKDDLLIEITNASAKFIIESESNPIPKLLMAINAAIEDHMMENLDGDSEAFKDYALSIEAIEAAATCADLNYEAECPAYDSKTVRSRQIDGFLLLSKRIKLLYRGK